MVTSNAEQTKILYRLLRGGLMVFTGLLIMVVAIVLWRIFQVEGRALSTLVKGEIVSLSILSALAAGGVIFIIKVGREIRKL